MPPPQSRILSIGFREIAALIFCFLAILGLAPGCSTVRVTDPPATATQLFLESEATRIAMQHISADQLRDRRVFVDTTFLTTVTQNSKDLSFRQTPQTFLFLVAELRAKLLMSGVRLVDQKEDAEIIVEARSGGVGVDHQEFLLGIPTLTVPTEVVAAVPFQTPEFSLFKSTKQQGFSSVAFVAYWRDTGEIVASSGPFVGRTIRQDFWFFGFGPSTVGNIPPAQKPAPSTNAKK